MQCPGRGAAFFTMHRRAGIHKKVAWTPEAHHAAKGGALRGNRGTPWRIP